MEKKKLKSMKSESMMTDFFQKYSYKNEHVRRMKWVELYKITTDYTVTLYVVLAENTK